jgi:hypothetical protein
MRDELLPPADSLRLSLRVFALFTVVYLCTWAGHYTSGDGSIKIVRTRRGSAWRLEHVARIIKQDATNRSALVIQCWPEQIP